MNDEIALIVLSVVGPGGLFAAALVAALLYRRLAPHEMLVVSSGRRLRVCEGGRLVIPLVQRAEVVDLRIKRLPVRRSGATALRCADGVTVDAEIVFAVRVNPTPEDVRLVVETAGATAAGDPETVRERFGAEIDAAIDQAFAEVDFDDVLTSQAVVTDRIASNLGRDLNGWTVEYVVITHAERS